MIADLPEKTEIAALLQSDQNPDSNSTNIPFRTLQSALASVDGMPARAGAASAAALEASLQPPGAAFR